MTNNYAAIYVRVSTEQQADPEKASPKSQEQDCRELAEKMGFKIYGVYADVEKYRVGRKLVEPSGTRSDRPQFLAMIDDARNAKFSTIFAWREDRFYRGVNKALLDISELVTNHHISIYTVKDHYDASVAVVKAWAAGLELEAKRDRTTMGIKSRLAQGKAWFHPNVLYGYNYDSKSGTVTVNEEHAYWVKKVWEWFANGLSTNEIRSRLLANNAPQGKDRPDRKYDWANRRILRMLDHESYYTGVHKIEWDNQTFCAIIPVIIDDPTIVLKVKARKEGYKSYPSGPTKYPTLTQGLAYCHADNVRLLMQGARGGYTKPDGSKVRYAYLRCECNKNHYAKEGCCKSISAKMLDEQVWDRVWEFISDGEKLKNAIDQRIEELKLTQKSSEDDSKRITQQLGDLVLERQEAISLRLKKIIKEEDLEFQLKQIATKEKVLHDQLEECKLSLSGKIENLSELCELFTTETRTGIEFIDLPPRSEKEKKSQFAIKQKILRALIKRIDVYEDHSFRILTEISMSNMPLVLESLRTGSNQLDSMSLFSKISFQSFRLSLYI